MTANARLGLGADHKHFFDGRTLSVASRTVEVLSSGVSESSVARVLEPKVRGAR
jgi:hypothetical protein